MTGLGYGVGLDLPPETADFLRGYEAGANDMEAGRLVTKDCVTHQYHLHVVEALVAERKAVEASALTAEEAQALLPCCDWILNDPGSTAADERLREATHRLSLIANERDKG